MILSDAMVKFFMGECIIIGASRISSWHEKGVAAKRLFIHPCPRESHLLA
jgi:hypothetical protein